MVSVRSTHLQHQTSFNDEQWLSLIHFSNPEAKQKFADIYAFCQQIMVQDNIDYLLMGRDIVEILSMLNMDVNSLCAGLLFPFVQYNQLALEHISERFGREIQSLIKIVLTMDDISHLTVIYTEQSTVEQIDKIRRMLLAMVDDFRCVIIKLAERIMFLHFYHENEAIKTEAYAIAATECSHIYAPLANRLGIGQLKWELEDLCFRYQYPKEYRRIAKWLNERRLDREKYVAEFVTQLQQAIDKEGLTADVYGRPKHIYSIWRKLKKKSLTFGELYDVRAIRIIVETLPDCYAVLGIVHTLFHHLPSEFDDYVANPKPNGYQSIHTVVFGPQGKTIEIQIRTRKMHEDAELGVAAHWKYKEDNKSEHSLYDEKIAWLRKLLDWQEDITDNSEILAEINSQVFEDLVYVFTPKGEVIDLPLGSTPLDFAYTIHSDVGHRCIGAKVAGRIVPFTYQLQMGDQIEIITQKNPNPSRDWLNPNLGFVYTSRARSKINNWFKKQDREKYYQAGKQTLDNMLDNLGLTIKEVERTLIKRYNMHGLDEFLVGIGSGDIRINQLINFLRTTFIKQSAEEQDKEALKQLNKKQSKQHKNNKKQSLVIIDGIGNLMHYLAKCCHPVPYDEIAGFITQSRGISIHRMDCEQFIELQDIASERIVNVQWGEVESDGFTVVIRVIANDRSGLLRDITTILANEKVNVTSVSTRTEAKQHIATLDIEMEIINIDILNRIINRLSQLTDVVEVKRLKH